MKVIVVGAGPGALADFTGRATDALKEADIVLTSDRLAQPLKQLNGNVRILGVMDTAAFINDKAGEDMKICVCASGDTGFYSIASTLAKKIDPAIDLEFISGIGSLAYFAAKVKMGYEDMKLVSLHGKDKSIVPYVCYNERVFTLTGGSIKAHDIIKSLREAGLSNVTLYIGEKLSMEEERIVKGSPAELADAVFDDLTVMIIENKDYVNRYVTLKDGDFVRGKSPMTKEAVRNLSVSALEIEPADIVYDIGAGTGSVTCAMALKACESMVYALEKEDYAVNLVKENMEKTGARNIIIRQAAAPDGMAAFPAADKVFIGGSTGNLKGIIETILVRNDKAVFVITAVTLETISQSVDVLKTLGMEMDITCANISQAQKLGRYNLMKAENPVYIIKGAKTFEK